MSDPDVYKLYAAKHALQYIQSSIVLGLA